MKFAGMLRADFKRMFLSWKFYTAATGIAVLTFLNVWPEANALRYECSVYYLTSARGGMGPFLTAFTVLIVLPFGLSYWEDTNHRYQYYLEARSGLAAYGLSHAAAAAFGAFSAVFLGYSICYGFLTVRFPLIQPDELDVMEEYLEAGILSPYDRLLPQNLSILYFAAVFATEALGYMFLAVLTLAVSVKIKNPFILLGIPVTFYYGSRFVCDTLNLPSIFRWYHIMESGGYFLSVSSDIYRLILGIFGYFIGLSSLICIVFILLLRRRKLNG